MTGGGCAKAWRTLVLAAGLACLAGCASGRPDLRDLLPTASTTRVVADWNDIDAAIDVAGEALEMAVLSSNRPEEPSRIIRLKTVQDQSVIVVVEREPEPPTPQPGPDDGEGVLMILRSTVGRFGDGARERKLLGALGKRLEELRGVEVRRLR